MAVLKILQLSDLHITPRSGQTMLGIDTEAYFLRTLQHAHEHHGPFALILLTGDLAQDPCSDSYQRICSHLLKLNTPSLCLPGNHDDYTLMQQHLNSGQVSCNKQTIMCNWHIILLNSQKPNSAVGALTNTELDFLSHALQSHPDLPTLIAMHHHCIPSSASWLNTMQIEDSDCLLTLIKQHPQVKGVTFGHVHQDYSTRNGHIDIFACPASCFQFAPDSKHFCIADTPPGYRVFELNPSGHLESTVYRLPITMHDLDRSAHEY